MIKTKKFNFLLLTFFVLINRLYAQIEFPAGDFWSLDAGLGMSDILVRGSSVQLIIDPKVWLSPPLMIGSKVGINYSSEEKTSSNILSNILTFESQAYVRWNFLRLGRIPQKKFNIFIQGGLGLIAAYRGNGSPFDDVTLTRGSLLAEAAAGVTIPITARWHIEPLIRVGYPHILGVSVTCGYKFPLPEKTRYIETSSVTASSAYDTTSAVSGGETLQPQIEYIEIIRTLPPEEIIKLMTITSIEFILFGPDIGRYNIGIDHDAQGLNELVLNSISQMLDDNRDLRVRIEGHANPVTTDPNEAAELMALGSMRANAVADQLRRRDVNEDQLIIVSFGGTRTVTSDHDIWNRNRRVELMIIQVGGDSN